MHFIGFGPKNNCWIAGHEIDDNEVLDIYWKINPDIFPPSK